MNALSLGHSHEGRPLLAYAFGQGPTWALVHGGIHGDEPGAVAAAERFCRRLGTEGPRIIIVPAVNPDGLAANQKDNARGVDLNRNFPASSWCADHPTGYYPGSAPLSEPESRALATLIENEKPAHLIALHQPFRCINFDGPAQKLAQAMAEATGWPVVANLGYPTPGSFGSYYGIDHNLPVITLELPRPAGEEDFAATLRALALICAR